LAVETIRLRWIGHRVRAEVGFTVDPDLSGAEVRAIAVEGERRLLHAVPSLAGVTVQIGPSRACFGSGTESAAD